MEKTGWEILDTLAIGALPHQPVAPAPPEPNDQIGFWRG
jgi:hypothetical protein